MSKQAKPKVAKAGDNPDRKNGKAWKKNPKGNPIPTRRTIDGYSVRRVSEWVDLIGETPLSNTKQHALDQVIVL